MPEREDNLPPLRAAIAAHGLTAKRSLGQNFLLDLNLTRRIARAAGPLEETTLYEVGPGPGGLTRALLAEGAARVVAVERDRRCLPALAEIAAAYPGRLDIVEADALALDERAMFGVEPVRVAANLPYNIGTALLVKWLTAPGFFWQSLTLMFQREVAERIVAQPGSKAYGRLSVLAAWRTRAKILFDVSPRAFTPPPKVTSSIVRIEPLAQPLAQANLADIERITEAAFGQRRKMLRQSLKPLLSEDAIRAAGIDPTRRAETLSVMEFAALARQLVL
ncbi:MAG: 16S rRNA (adenine(1518)-N(6)/adenine(1519)-N(6))-dimethyltransferase RsmA [Alphaproteobacteria bacterium]|nr:16S rRNA (adenine(1518)-N(6)/adenine(1519)-N(6))-dimethyltransferase RsmA [Alphaproteobacteria bacterium]MBV9693620.1 16S rRNA (adenine(1518)-N(6)/adenine(1519)-N(6))-dimethyltransferase RsmA [Alphaproteobacteria bacterium]